MRKSFSLNYHPKHLIWRDNMSERVLRCPTYIRALSLHTDWCNHHNNNQAVFSISTTRKAKIKWTICPRLVPTGQDIVNRSRTNRKEHRSIRGMWIADSKINTLTRTVKLRTANRITSASSLPPNANKGLFCLSFHQRPGLPPTNDTRSYVSSWRTFLRKLSIQDLNPQLPHWLETQGSVLCNSAPLLRHAARSDVSNGTNLR